MAFGIGRGSGRFRGDIVSWLRRSVGARQRDCVSRLVHDRDQSRRVSNFLSDSSSARSSATVVTSQKPLWSSRCAKRNAHVLGVGPCPGLANVANGFEE